MNIKLTITKIPALMSSARISKCQKLTYYLPTSQEWRLIQCMIIKKLLYSKISKDSSLTYLSNLSISKILKPLIQLSLWSRTSTKERLCGSRFSQFEFLKDFIVQAVESGTSLLKKQKLT